MDELLRSTWLEQTEIVAYADCVVIVVNSRRRKLLESTTSTCLELVVSWANKHKIKVSQNKTQ